MTQDIATPRKVRPFYWSVRRELWENGSIYLAPLAVAGVTLFAFLLGTFRLAHNVRRAAETAAARAAMPLDPVAIKAAIKASNALELPYDVVAGLVFVTAALVGVFYCLGALHGERRDRSILFWKSLPVSDLTTVLSKASLPLVVLPVVVFATAFCAHLVMLFWSSLVLLTRGIPLAELTTHLPIPYMWLAMSRGLVIMALWYAPVVAWLMLVSGWAKRMAILWAIGPWLALCIVERLAFNSKFVFAFVARRLGGGFTEAFSVHGTAKAPVRSLADLDPWPVLANPELWFGLVLAALLFAACVRLRRYRDPI